MRTIFGSLVLGVFVVACGGEAPKPVESPPTPPAMPTSPTPPVDTAPPVAATPPKPSMQDMQKALVGSVSDGINGHDAAKFSANYADDAVVMVSGMPDQVRGKDAIAADVKKVFDAFPNVKFGFGRVWAKNDVLVCEWVDNGTHSGDLMGIKATEKPVGYTGLSVVWVNSDGKIKEEHRYFDLGTIMSQVGASKAKARPIPALPTTVEWHWAKSDAVEDKGVDAMKAAYTAFEKKDEKAFGDMNADDVVWDDMIAPGPSKGKAEALKQFKAFTTAFTDLKMQATNSWAVEDYGISEVTTTGTPKGPFMGLVSQNKKPISLHMVDVVQMKDGKAVRGWSYGNSVELLTQFGIMKPPGSAPAPAAKTEPKPAPKADPKGDPKAAPKK